MVRRAILFCTCMTLILPISEARTREIRMWRDRNGVLNVTNVTPVGSGQKTRKALAEQTVTSRIEVSTPRASFISVRPTARRNIYVHVDSSGVRNFTNIPTGGERYTLAFTAQTSSNGGSLSPRRSDYDDIVADAARAYQVDQALVRAVIHAESAFNPSAVSPKGATGLMQLMPDTARRYGVHDLFDPTDNVHGGVRYLRDLLDKFDNDLRLVVAAYNAGENAVARYGDVPPYPETTNYVQRVLSLHSRYRDVN